MAQFTRYWSTDASAPVLTGAVGSLTALLDAILVNGYGSKAAAGWSTAFTATNQRDYLMPATAVSRRYLQVDDTASGTGGAKEALCMGFETMSAYNTGTGQFPTTAQLSGGPVWRKSATADATARTWKAYADDRTLYLLVAAGDFASTYYGYVFGEIYSLLPGDIYASMIIGRTTQNSAVSGTSVETMAALAANQGGAVQGGHYIDRSHLGTGGSLQVLKIGDGALKTSANAALLGLGNITYPNPPDSGLYISPVRVLDAANYRGRLRGLWDWQHAVGSVADGDTLSPASGDYSGKTFDIIKGTMGAGIFLVETSATLETL